jgi:hypothetical protein
MKVSGFTFLRDAEVRGYPFVESIRSVLPIVDEFVIALGPCTDRTEALLKGIGSPKLRIIRTTWNENIGTDRKVKGFVYGQQKSIALFNCTGDWAFYLEGDEVVHEREVPAIREAMQRHLRDREVEALTFDYLHFYGNRNTVAWSPAWYRREVRILRNTIPAWGPEGLFFVVLDSLKRGRYPKAAHTNAAIYHYGWARPESCIQLTKDRIEKYWSSRTVSVKMDQVDARILHPFVGTHPAVMRDALPPASGLFQADPNHRLTGRERRHRFIAALEKTFNLDLTKKHFRLVRATPPVRGRYTPAPISPAPGQFVPAVELANI